MDNISDKEWERFFETLQKIVNSEGSWDEKMAVVKEKAEENNAAGEMGEFVSWWDEG